MTLSQGMMCHQIVSIVYLALGSNVTSQSDGPESILRKAISRLGDDSTEVLDVSNFYATPAYPPGSGPEFVNAAISVKTVLSAQDLLQHVHQLEHDFGRERIVRWAPRVLDIDLIAYGDVISPDKATFLKWRDLPLGQQKDVAPQQLILPHPRLEDRSFVLVPLHDIAPEWHHPVTGLTVAQMLAARPKAEKAEIRRLL